MPSLYHYTASEKGLPDYAKNHAYLDSRDCAAANEEHSTLRTSALKNTMI